MFGVCQEIGCLIVIRQQKQSAAVFVESADWNEAGSFRTQHIVDGCSSFFVRCSCDNIHGLVENEVTLPPGLGFSAADKDLILFHVDPSMRVLLDLSVDGNLSIRDVQKRSRSRSQAQFGQSAGERNPMSRMRSFHGLIDGSALGWEQSRLDNMPENRSNRNEHHKNDHLVDIFINVRNCITEQVSQHRHTENP